MLSVPGKQMSPTQHPLQLAAEHAAEPLQAPPVPASTPAPPGEQLCPVAEQSTHSSPPVPHVGSRIPSTQMLPTQQPEQLAGPQVVVEVQAPASTLQEVPVLVQSVHVAPPLPQAVGAEPIRQVPPSTPPQQPSQTPPLPHPVALATHVWLVPSQEEPTWSQSMQAAPSVPQAVSPMPRWQAPFSSQQPVGQVDAEQPPLSGPASCGPASPASAVVASVPGAASGRPKSR